MNERNHNQELSTEYYQEGKLEKELWFQVATRDYTELISAFDFNSCFSRFETPIELLDVGCGTGKFPSMLASLLPSHIQVQYDYLDPSQHSLDELRKSLTSPFAARTAFNSTLEALKRSGCPANGYQLIWCLQSLYCIQHQALDSVMKKLYSLLDITQGMALIYLASSHAFYHQLYNTYNQEYYPDIRQPYVTAEDVTTTLCRLQIPHQVKKLHFPHTIEDSDRTILKNYINQCVFDAEAWERSQNNILITDLLNSFCHEGLYQFRQEMWLISLTSHTGRTENLW